MLFGNPSLVEVLPGNALDNSGALELVEQSEVNTGVPAAGSCTCPQGQVTYTTMPAGKRTDGTGPVHRLQAFQFDGAVCRACLLQPQCIAAKGRKGPWVLNPSPGSPDAADIP